MARIGEAELTIRADPGGSLENAECKVTCKVGFTPYELHEVKDGLRFFLRCSLWGKDVFNPHKPPVGTGVGPGSLDWPVRIPVGGGLFKPGEGWVVTTDLLYIFPYKYITGTVSKITSFTFKEVIPFATLDEDRDDPTDEIFAYLILENRYTLRKVRTSSEVFHLTRG